MSMKRIGVSNSCSCVKIDLSSGNEFYAVDIFPEDEVKALMAYFISESQRVGCQLNPRIVGIKVESLQSTSQSFSPYADGINQIRMKACVRCESEMRPRKPVERTILDAKMSCCQARPTKSPSRRMTRSPKSSSTDIEHATLCISRFSELMKRLFQEDSHCRCSVTLACDQQEGPSHALPSKSDVTDDNQLRLCDQNSSPASCFSPLSQSVASVTRPRRGRSAMRTVVGASLYPAGMSVGLLHLDAPLRFGDEESTVVDLNFLDRNSLQIETNMNRDNDLPVRKESREKLLPPSSQSPSICESPMLITSLESAGRRRSDSRKSRKDVPRSDDSRSRSEHGSVDPNQSEHLRNSLSGNQSACSRTSTERSRERERSVRGISPLGPHSHLLLLAEKEREKGSRRSIDTQNKLNGILNRRGRSRSTSTDGKFSGLPPRTTKPVTSANMKSLLMESSAGGFQGLQLETVDPVFFKNSRSSAVSSPSSSSSSSHRLRGPFRDDLESSPSVTISAGVSLSVSVKEKEKVKVKVKRGSLESLGAMDVESRTATDATATTCITAKSNAVDELLIWKKGMPVSDKDQVDNSCPSTPSTVADPHTSLDHDNEFNSLAQAYGDSYPSYTLLPMEDGSVFAGLNQAPSDIEGLSAVPPPEESLAYSAYSASDTHTRDIISPKGTNYFTRKLSGRSTSLLGNVYDNVTARIGSIFTAVTSGSTLLDIKIPLLSSNEAASVSRAALIDVNVKKDVNTLQNCGNKNKIENKIEIVPDVENVIEIENNKIGKIENENKKEAVGNTTSSLTDTECDPTLLPMLCGVTKLKPDIRALVWGCIVTRQIQVLDAAIALNRILKHDDIASSKKGSSKKKKNEKIATKDMEKDVEKRKKSECQIVCQVLEKITKQRLGQNLAIARAVSSCCLLLVYLQLEIKWEEHSEKKKNGSIAEKGSSSSERSENEGLNELIVSRFDRLAVVTLSPFLQYSDVQWLSLSDKFPSDNRNEKIEDASPKKQPMLENTPKVLLSPRLRKRKSDVTSDVPESEFRSLKKRKSVSGKSPSTPTTTPIEEKTKRDCLCDIVASLKLRYNGLTVIAPAIRRLSRNYRPTVGIPGEQSESDSSPYRSEYFSESPKSAKIARKSGTELDKVVAPVDRFLQILANKGPIIDSFTLRRSLSGAVRKQPMIPLSDAGAAQLLSLNSETPVPVLPIVESMESAEISKASVGSSKTDGHSLKRTNSIVNVHKQSVGQRTGRVKVKNVRTSLKPDPNINSILSFTVPQRASLGSTIQKSPGSKGKSKGTSPKGLKISRERSTSSKTSSSGVPMDSLRSMSDVLGSGGNVRRSARKRPRDETDSWRDSSMSSSSGIMCDVDEVADTPLDKVRARKNRTIIPNSGGPRTLRGRSPDNHDTKDRKSSSRSSLLTGNLGITDDQPWGGSLNGGIAASKNCEAFGSESSGRKRAARKRASSPFFLPSVDLHSARYAEHSSGVTDDQTHSAGVALGMELYMDDDQAHSQSRRSPRFLRGNKENIRGLTGSTVRAIPYPIPDKGELDRGLNSGGSSFSRNVYMQPDSAAHSRRSFQSDHWFQDQSTPLTSRGRERGGDEGDANFDHLKTPPDKHLRQSRQHFASPIATSRTATDEDRDSLRDRNGDGTAPLSARASDVIGYRSSPRRNLRPA